MSWATFFPEDTLSLVFVMAVIAWFVSWLLRLHSESARLDSAGRLLTSLDGCIDPLRTQQLWRDRQRMQGNNVGIDPAEFFNVTCSAQFASDSSVNLICQNHFRAIFVAGCDESSLDATELNAQTCQELAARPKQLGVELLLILLLGAVGTLLAFSHRYTIASFVSSLDGQRALPPLIWAALSTTFGGVLYLQFQGRKLAPTLAELRRKTTTLWIPRLYPTVAQRAAQWAIHTLKNAARVNESSEVIEQHARNFVGSIDTARQAAEVFSGGMREFSHGITISDRALQNAQTKLAANVERFADSLGRWGEFENEIRLFYSAVEMHGRRIEAEHKTFEAMLTGYFEVVRQSTAVLSKSASDIASVAQTLPQAFAFSADKMSETAANFQQYLATTVENLGSEMRSTYRTESGEMQSRLQAIVHPVMNLEDRLKALSTPFESASNKLVEIAENLWRLNDNFEQKVVSSLEELKTDQSRAAKSGT